MATLYQITGEYLRLYNLMTDEDLMETEDDAIKDTLESLNYDLADKSAGYVHVIKQLDMEADECDRAIEFFKHKKEVRENRVKAMKNAICEAMQIAKVDELNAGKFKIKIKGNGGVEPLKITGDVPENYKRIIVENDTELIRKALNEGKELDFAHLEPRGKHIEIK